MATFNSALTYFAQMRTRPKSRPRRLANGQDVEVWQRDRQLATFTRSIKALSWQCIPMSKAVDEILKSIIEEFKACRQAAEN